MLKRYRLAVTLAIFSLLSCFLPSLLLCANSADIVNQKEVEQKSFLFQTNLITQHWGEEDNLNANNHQAMFNLEYHRLDSRLYGIARFKNSFSQWSYYVYTGKTYNLAQTPDFKITGKLTYGIIHGYDDEDGKYNSIYTRLGTFPAVIPFLGIRKGDFELGILPLSIEGIMATLGIWF